jgi:hypothetical protein
MQHKCEDADLCEDAAQSEQDIGGLEILGHDGFLFSAVVPPGDPEHLAGNVGLKAEWPLANGGQALLRHAAGKVEKSRKKAIVAVRAS